MFLRNNINDLTYKSERKTTTINQTVAVCLCVCVVWFSMETIYNRLYWPTHSCVWNSLPLVEKKRIKFVFRIVCVRVLIHLFFFYFSAIVSLFFGHFRVNEKLPKVMKWVQNISLDSALTLDEKLNADQYVILVASWITQKHQQKQLKLKGSRRGWAIIKRKSKIEQVRKKDTNTRGHR